MARSREDKAAEKAEKAAEKAARDAAQEAELARQAFEESPAGQARAAAERGDGFFEIELDLRTTGNLNPYGATGVDQAASWTGSNRPVGGRMDVLSQIEREGWVLFQANHVHVQLGEESRDKWGTSGQRTSIKGKIVGVYLFRRVEARAYPPVGNGDSSQVRDTPTGR
jgi:hypothetical protein